MILFDTFQFDPDSGELFRDDKRLGLLPKDSAVLNCLLSHPGKLVSKQDLLRDVWKGVTVSDGVVKTCIKRLRRHLGDDSKKPVYIETFHRRGYRFIGRVETGSKARASSPPTRRPPKEFVGRKRELTVLREAYEQAAAGRSRYLFITGEAGIGKSALVGQFEEEVRRQARALIARGHCVSTLGPGEAYAPLFEILEMMANRIGGERFGELMRRFAPMWMPHISWLLKPGEADVLAGKLIGATAQRMLRELVMLLGAMARETTVVLIIEDAHWADGATLDALTILINRLVSRNIMVVVTYRPEEAINSLLKKLKLEILRHDHCKKIALEPLSEDDIDLYLSIRFAGKARPMMLAAWLMRYTEGNPLFAKALLDHAEEKGWLIIGAQVTWEEPASGDIAWSVPHSLRELIRHTFDRMPTRFRDNLQLAGVVGLSFQTKVLCRDSIADETVMEEQFNELAEAYHFIVPDGAVTWPDGTRSPCYTFAHAWYRQVVYDQIPLLRKQELHRFVGERLESIYHDLCYRIAAVLAIHFELARDSLKAIKYRRMAAEVAWQRHAYQEVQGHMERGLELIAMLPDETQRRQQEISFRILLGTTLTIIDGYAAPAVVDNYTRARKLCRQTEGDAHLIPVLYGLWAYYMARSEFDVSADFINRFELAANRAGSALDVGYAQYMASLNNFYQGRFSAAKDKAEICLSYSEPGDVNTLLQMYGLDSWSGSLTHKGLSNWCLGYPESALADIDASVAFAEALDLPAPLAAALACKTGVDILSGDLEVAATRVDRLVQITEVHGVEYWKFHGVIYKGYLEAAGGDPETGLRRIRDALAIFDQSGTLITQTFFYFLYADAHARAGAYEGGLDCLNRWQKNIEANAARWLTADIYRLKGDLILAVSRTNGQTPEALKEAEANYRIALDTARCQESKFFELRAAMGLGRLRLLQGRPDDAKTLLKDVYDWFDEGFGTQELRAAKSLLEKLS